MARQTVRIGFRHFWRGFSLESFRGMFPFLQRGYRFVESDKPDVLFFSSRTSVGTRFPHVVDAAPVTVFLTGENIRPEMDRCDFAISFRRDVADRRHLRLPNYVTDLYLAGFGPQVLLKKPTLGSKSKFCAFVQRNCRFELRKEFVRLLNRHKQVDCPGKCLNNMPRLPPRSENPASRRDLYEFLANYRFVVAFENCDPDDHSGYVTEKIVNAMVAGAIPIYFGDPRVADDFNEDSFIHVRRFDSLAAVVDRVRYLDETPAAYAKLYETPWFRNGRLPGWLEEHRLLAFFDQIFAAARSRRPCASP